ncbi:hypothetical protein [Pelagibius sp.]|uniref:hypothetical protein n=1 Tax=Pelagibius sp. TaxID=1931238 RepID=UPI0026339411|nr:hypothetical protein [Pelagibius sp.]
MPNKSISNYLTNTNNLEKFLSSAEEYYSKPENNDHEQIQYKKKKIGKGFYINSGISNTDTVSVETKARIGNLVYRHCNRRNNKDSVLEEKLGGALATHGNALDASLIKELKSVIVAHNKQKKLDEESTKQTKGIFNKNRKIKKSTQKRNSLNYNNDSVGKSKNKTGKKSVLSGLKSLFGRSKNHNSKKANTVDYMEFRDDPQDLPPVELQEAKSRHEYSHSSTDEQDDNGPSNGKGNNPLLYPASQESSVVGTPSSQPSEIDRQNDPNHDSGHIKASHDKPKQGSVGSDDPQVTAEDFEKFGALPDDWLDQETASTDSPKNQN